MAQRNITDAAVIASKTQHGIAHAQCIEATFGAKVMSSFIAVVFAGPRDGFRLETSIDYGRTWQEIFGNGKEIPGLSPGTVVIHVEVLTRIFFLDHQDTVLIKQITTTVVLDSGPEATPDTITRTESGALLGSGALIGCVYDPMRDGLAAIPQVSLEFSATATTAYGTAWHSPHRGDERPEGLHISHGRPILVNQEQGQGNEVVVEAQDVADPEHLDFASCTIEIWVYPTAIPETTEVDRQTILSWMVDLKGDGSGPLGSALQLLPVPDPDTPGGPAKSARIQFIRYGYTFKTPDIYIQSAAAIPINQWSRVVFIYGGYRARLIINDVVSNSVAFKTDPKEAVNVPDNHSANPYNGYGTVIHTTGTFMLGNNATLINPSAPAHPRQFCGRLSELRLYNREATLATGFLKGRRRLSQNDIDMLVVRDGLTEYWPLNDGEGSIAVGKVQHIPLIFNSMGSPSGANWSTSYDTFLGRPYEITQRQSTHADDPSTPDNEEAFELVVTDIRYAPARTSMPMIVEAQSNVVRITNAPFDVMFPDGRVFQGVGQFASLDTIQEPTEIGPTGINVAFTALDQSLVGLAMRAIYLDGTLTAYEVYFDANDQLVQDPVLIFGGLMDSINIQGGKEPTVVVSAESQLRNWQRSSIIKWNDEGHRARYPHDYGFEFVGRTVDQVVWWPRKTSTSGFGQE